MRFKPLTPQTQITPAQIPITKAPTGPTKPAAGVTPTKPAIAPDAAPNMDGRPLMAHSVKTHAIIAPTVAIKVLNIARAATSFAASEEPALKPNQPTHNNAAPVIVMGRLWGCIASLPYPKRLPTTNAPTNAAIPALMCTTVPPAKSNAPFSASKPFEVSVVNQIMWATGM